MTNPRKRALPDDARRRTIWIGNDLWASIERAARADERTASAWIRRTAEEKIQNEKQN